LDISPLIFPVSKLVHAVVIKYNEFFQALAEEGDVLPPKPFLEPTSPTVQLQLKPLRLPRLADGKNISKASNFHLPNT
jgi:hypothetical protein